MDELAEDYKEIIRPHRLGVRLFQGLLSDLLAGMELGVIDTILSPGCGQVQTALAGACPALIGRDPAATPRYAVAADLRVLYFMIRTEDGMNRNVGESQSLLRSFSTHFVRCCAVLRG
eukprot:COSAG01_NODE_3675_length_5804_cov_4.926919_8_plen_118_part_00